MSGRPPRALPPASNLVPGGWPTAYRTPKLFIRPVFRDGDRPRGRSFRASALSRSCDCGRAAPGDL